MFLVDYQFTVVFSVFRLVGGLETLSALERVETDEKDRPKVPVKKKKKNALTKFKRFGSCFNGKHGC